MAVGCRAVGLERENHAFLQLDRVVDRVEAADDRPLVQRQPQAVAKLQAKRLHLAVEAEVLGFGPGPGDHVGRDAGLDHVDAGIDPLARLLVGVALALGGAADAEGPVVAGPVAVVGLDDVEEGLVAGTDQPIGEHVRMRAATLAGDSVDCLNIVRAHVVELLVCDRHQLVLADPRLEGFVNRLVDAIDERRRHA